jgi:hypothetical protein
MNKMKKKSIYYASSISIGILIALLFNLKKSVIIQPDALLPDLTYEGKMGTELIERDSTKNTVVVWFHPDCEHCIYQLSLINDHIQLLGGARFFFLTAAKNFPASIHLGLWPALTSAEQVRFGILDEEKFTASFGRVVTPTIFIFNRQGRLKEKLFGEVKIDKIKNLITNPVIPKHEKSGIN